MTDDFPQLKAWAEACGRTISIVGAGGKTTLLYRLAGAFAEHGDTCILTTTTHILRPAHLPVTDHPQALRTLLKTHPVVVYAALADDGKLAAPQKMAIGHPADWLLAEADGAKQLPCKVPAAHEPVILPGTQAILGVMGMRALHKPLREVCFRLEYALPLLGHSADAPLSARDLVKILLSGQGTRKAAGDLPYGVVLSQCEADPEGALEIKELLHQQGQYNVFCLRHPEERRKNGHTD